MKEKVLVVGENLPCYINIGDYIQALASSQFLNSDYDYVEREKLKDYQGDECKVIMNGWYMHHPEQWPPSPNIYPLFVAFHMNKLVINRFLREDSISYLKKYAPIGCRDIYTSDLLRKHGVESYFSGCMTLTLGYKYKTERKSGKTYFVDPFFRLKSRTLQWKIKAMSYLITSPLDTFKIRKKRNLSTKLSIGDLLDNAWFLKIYSSVFDKKLLFSSEYIYHESSFYANELKTNFERMQYAEKLVKMYSEASMVVTSRIHCALPCTGMEVPVIYIDNEEQDEISSCRLGGLKELFNIVSFKDKKLYHNLDIKGKITPQNMPPIKTSYRTIAETLIERCRNFINNTSN